MNYVLKAETGIVNFSAPSFHRWATHYYKCYEDFKVPGAFSPVPYFLLCRAIELELKSRLLQTKRQEQIKTEFGHDLIAAYKALPSDQKSLDDGEFELLASAASIYVDKGFEYVQPIDAAHGFSRFPNLSLLAMIARKLIDHRD